MLLIATAILVADVLIGLFVILTFGIGGYVLVFWVPLAIVGDWVGKRIRITHPWFGLLLRIVSWPLMVTGSLVIIAIVWSRF